MPENRYMGVDDRRDHSFKIPRPDLSLTFDAPNACTKCHDDKSNQWANDKLNAWHGKPEDFLASKRLLILLNRGQAISLQQHLSILTDEKLDVISRASAVQLLSYTTQTLTIDMLAPYLLHKEPLFRLNSATVAAMLPPSDKVRYLAPLLKDEYKAVRVSAVRSLLSSEISQADHAVFDQAFKELMLATKVNSWRGEGMANQGFIAIEMNQFSEAEQSFKKAIKIDPYFEAAYINLADIYRAQKKPFQTNSVLSKGIKNNPDVVN
jgi:tetratricopeptide (TPR) repeat protein